MDEVGSFIFYSFVVYPLVNYLLSSQRKYNKWIGILFVILIHLLISYFQYLLEQSNNPSYYNLLNVSCDSTILVIKKSFKKLSLILHPDKNKSPGADAKYLQIKNAYETLINLEKRDLYNRFGEMGIQPGYENSFTLENLILPFLFRKLVSAFMVVILTLTDPSGNSRRFSLLFLAGIILFEVHFVLLGESLPSILLPFFTPHDILIILSFVHHSGINCSRAIFSSLHIDPLQILSARVASITASQKVLNSKFLKVINQYILQNDYQNNLQSYNNMNSNNVNSSNKENELLKKEGIELEEKKKSDQKIFISITSTEEQHSPIHDIIKNLRNSVAKEDPKSETSGVNLMNRLMKACLIPPKIQVNDHAPLYFLVIYLIAQYLVDNYIFPQKNSS